MSSLISKNSAIVFNNYEIAQTFPEIGAGHSRRWMSSLISTVLAVVFVNFKVVRIMPEIGAGHSLRRTVRI